MSDEYDIPPQAGDEPDDVEGHGIKEVTAAAIGAAAITTGGIAVAATGHAPGPAVAHPAVVSQVQHGTGGQAPQDATSTTANRLNQETSVAAPAIDGASNAAMRASDLANRTLDETSAAASHNLAATYRLANDSANRTLQSVNHTESVGLTTAKGAEHAVASDATGVHSTTLTVVKATEDRVGNGWTLDLSVLGVHTSNGGNMLAPNGTVTVVDQAGRTIASAKVINGAATVHFSDAGISRGVTINYTGTPSYSTTSSTWLPPFM